MRQRCWIFVSRLERGRFKIPNFRNGFSNAPTWKMEKKGEFNAGNA